MTRGGTHDHPGFGATDPGSGAGRLTSLLARSDSARRGRSACTRRRARTSSGWAVALLVSAFLTGCGGNPTTTEPNGTGTSVIEAPQASRVSSQPAGSNNAMSWPVPNQTLTPGAIVPGCTYPRPARSPNEVTNAERQAIATTYHYTGRTGLTYVEYDHRIPYSLCGLGGVGLTKNIWPEPADGIKQTTFVHNRKDQLEDIIASLVRNHSMTLVQGQAIFTGDWRLAWCKYVHSAGVTCP